MIKSKTYFLIIIFISILSRAFAIHFTGDRSIEYNEFGIILYNLENYGTFGFRKSGEEIFPNIFMPTLYPFFLYLIQLLNPIKSLFLDLVLYLQLIYSIIGIIYFKKLLLNFFTEKLSNLGATIFALFPLNIYCVSQISSISLQVFLSILFFYLTFQIIKNSNLKNLLSFSLISGLLILLRGEFFVFYFLTLFFIFITNKNIKIIIFSLFISLIVVSPYVIRNYYIFETLTITKSFGYNLWKGNNPKSKSQGYETIYDEEMQKKIDEIYPSAKYDLYIDKIYKAEAIKNIKLEPFKYVKSYFKKIFAYLFVDFESSYPNYYNLLHILPKILISILSLAGVFYLIKKRSLINYFTAYYFLNILLFSIFFIIPRYSLILLPVQIILSCYFFKKLKIYTRD